MSSCAPGRCPRWRTRCAASRTDERAKNPSAANLNSRRVPCPSLRSVRPCAPRRRCREERACVIRSEWTDEPSSHRRVSGAGCYAPAARSPSPRRKGVSLAPGISGHQIIPSSTVMRLETTNRSTGHLGANRGVRPKTRREPGAPQSRDPVRKPPTRTLTRDRAARPRLRVRVVTCVHHNILEPRGVRASSDLTGSPSPRPPPSLRVSSLTPKTRGLSASSQPCRTSSRWCPRACAS